MKPLPRNGVKGWCWNVKFTGADNFMATDMLRRSDGEGAMPCRIISERRARELLSQESPSVRLAKQIDKENAILIEQNKELTETLCYYIELEEKRHKRKESKCQKTK